MAFLENSFWARIFPSPLLIAFEKRAVGNGKCIGDVVWTGIWCRTDEDVGYIHAKIMGDLADHSLRDASSLHLCSSDPYVLWGI